MSRVDAILERGRRQGRPLVIPFVTAGFPSADSTVPVVAALIEAGADMVEIGIPFSDPLADGPTIQRASERALANGVTPAAILESVRTLRAGPAGAGTPLLLMGYCNPLFHYGLDRFLEDAAAAGADGLIVPDLPPEEGEEYRRGCIRNGLAAVFLMAPNSPDERIRGVDAASTHFSYCVSVTGVTGARGQVQARTVGFLDRVRKLASRPFVVGFGIKGPEHVEALAGHAAGVVVGSALIDRMEGADDPAGAAAALVEELRRAADRAGNRGGEEPAADDGVSSGGAA